jgi:hypothetical protein
MPACEPAAVRAVQCHRPDQGEGNVLQAAAAAHRLPREGRSAQHVEQAIDRGLDHCGLHFEDRGRREALRLRGQACTLEGFAIALQLADVHPRFQVAQVLVEQARQVRLLLAPRSQFGLQVAQVEVARIEQTAPFLVVRPDTDEAGFDFAQPPREGKFLPGDRLAKPRQLPRRVFEVSLGPIGGAAERASFLRAHRCREHQAECERDQRQRACHGAHRISTGSGT